MDYYYHLCCKDSLDFEARLDGKTFVYKTDTYITIDFNGRLPKKNSKKII